jgi:multiple sugar transport system substrate-binding protein
MNTPSRRTVLTAAGAALLAGCGRLSGEEKSGGGEQVVKWAQFYTTQSGPAAEANKRWLQSVKSAFERDNAGWTVQYEGYQWDQLDQRLILDLRANVPHDVSLTSPQLMAQHAQASSLLDLTPYVEKWGNAAEFTWSPVWKSGSLDGKQLGIPLGVATRGVAYRRAAYREVPASLEDFVRAAKKVGKNALSIYLGPDRATTELSFAPLVWHFGGDFFDTQAKEAALTSDAVVEAVNWLRAMVHEHKVVPASSYAPTAAYDDVTMKQFLSGTGAAAWGFGNYWIQALEEAKLIKGCYPASAGCRPDQVDVMPTPTRGQAQFTNAWMISIGAQSKQPEMAWKLIETMLRPELLREYPDAGLPARQSEYQQPAYSSEFYQRWREIAEHGRGMPPTPYYSQLADTVAAALQEIIGKTGDVKKTLGRYEDEWNKQHGGK